jgi:hypothetical protein
MSTLPKSLRDLGSAARQATDNQIMKLVSMVDALPERGAADSILEPVRARLKHLRPERTLNPPRLLFLPLDAVLQNPRDWRPGTGQVPRTAIAPLLAALRAAEPRVFQAVEDALAGQSLRNGQIMSQLGAALWTAAARSFPAEPPPGWDETGLPLAAFAPIAETCKPLWRHGAAIWSLRLSGADGPREQDLRVAFRAIAPDGPEVVGTVLSALLPYVVNPAQMIAIVGGLDRSLAGVAEQVLDKYLAGIDPDLDFSDLAAVAAAAERFARVLQDLDRAPGRERPKRAQLLHSLRQAAADACSSRLTDQVGSHLVQPLLRLIAAAAVTDAEVDALEASALALRSIASSGRGLRPGNGFDRSLLPAIELLERSLPALAQRSERYARADALRVLEILAGPSAAARHAA